MATLHKVTEETRAIAKWGVVTLIGFFLLFFVVRVGINIKEHFFPTPAPPPTTTFGTLQTLQFPESVTDKKLSYTINTLSGLLPTFPDRVTIYPLSTPKANLLSASRAQENVTSVGFLSSGVPISDTLYKWSENKKPFKTLTLDIVSSNFTITSNYLSNQDIATAKTPPGKVVAISAVKTFLTKMSLLPTDLDDAKTKVTFYMLQNGQFVEAPSQSSAVATRIDFFQKDVDFLPIYYPVPKSSTMHFILTAGDTDPQIIQATFTHYAIESQSSTYPIKTAKEAFDQLQKGKAYIASSNSSGNNVQIKTVFLAYYLGEENTEYVLPIIVFEGENNFFAYVPAVTNEWISPPSR